MRNSICTFIGLAGSVITNLFGGWSAALQALVIAMVVDYLSGFVVAAVFQKSNKSENGGLNSRAGWIGLIRKAFTLLFVLVAHYLDKAVGTTYIQSAVEIGFLANELISITENAALMGVKLPPVVKKAIDILNAKEDASIKK